MKTRSGAAVLAAAVALVAAGCSGTTTRTDTAPAPTAEGSPTPVASEETHAEETHAGQTHGGQSPGDRPATRPLRAGERRLTVTMPEPYTPSAPTGVGTDDYRCFLLDPGLDEPAYLTGTDVAPGSPTVVHHVILFQVPADQVAAAQAQDAAEQGQGWTCFGGSGVDSGGDLDDAPWLAAWAPGGAESVTRPGYGVRLEPGTQVVMQVHYNLLAGADPDTSAARLRVAGEAADLTPISTVLLPAPVELPCRPGREDGPLCDRGAALADVKARFGAGPGSQADLLHLLCGTPVRAGPVQTCERTLEEPLTVLGVAGHMHLLGRSIRIDVNPGTPEARRVLDIPVWDFDDQAARAVPPLALAAGDTVRVTCRHSQRLKDLLPALQQQPERYVVWGEGTTDEMCLGILQVSRP